MSPGKRVASSQPPLNFQHPYLENKVARKPQKRELGIVDLFVFKMFGCFTPDDLPPPNPNATVYQAGGRSSSSSVTLSSSVTAPAAAPTAAPIAAPPLPPPPASSSPISEKDSSPADEPLSQGRRRSFRPDRRSRRSGSMWPERVPDHASRAAVERTQFVEQRVEERKREAQRRLEEERARRAAAAAESSAAIAIHTVTEKKKPDGAPAPPKHERVSSTSSVDRLYTFERDNRSEGETSEVTQRESVLSDEGAMAASSVAGRVSRLSAMFENQWLSYVFSYHWVLELELWCFYTHLDFFL